MHLFLSYGAFRSKPRPSVHGPSTSKLYGLDTVCLIYLIDHEKRNRTWLESLRSVESLISSTESVASCCLRLGLNLVCAIGTAAVEPILGRGLGVNSGLQSMCAPQTAGRVFVGYKVKLGCVCSGEGSLYFSFNPVNGVI